MLVSVIRNSACSRNRLTVVPLTVEWSSSSGCSFFRSALVGRTSDNYGIHGLLVLPPCRFLSTANTSGRNQHQDYKNVRIASYLAAITIGVVGATYASVPLYKMFCQATGYGGTTQRVTLQDWEETQKQQSISEGTPNSTATGRKLKESFMEKLYSFSNVALPKLKQQQHGANTWTDEEAAAKLASLKPNLTDGRLIRVCFDSTVGDVLPWSFVPAQPFVKVVPGETALCFFTTTNHSSKAITGVATYNVYPPKAGLYFNKIQCFCFEEQRLLPGETVDMPVFFYIDPEYETDAALQRCNNITLVSIICY
jgi:cytochrome c oxidase assembly protein Cox11